MSTKLKSMLTAAQQSGQTVNVHFYDVTTFKYERPPLIKDQQRAPATVSRIQTKQFSLLRNGIEVWDEYGEAADWEFPNENTAVQTTGYDSSDHTVKTVITYTFG